MFMPVTDPAIGLGQAIEITRKQNAAIQKFPEVASVVAKIARADTSTDPAPVNMTETIVSLKPEREWRPGDDAREAHRRDGSGHHAARRVEHLDAAEVGRGFGEGQGESVPPVRPFVASKAALNALTCA